MQELRERTGTSGSTLSEHEILGVLSLASRIERLYFVHVPFYIARGDDGACEADTFLLVVDVCQYDGHLRFQGDIVKAEFPITIGLACRFGRDGDGKTFAVGEAFGQLVGERRGALAVYRNATHGSEQAAEREKEPLLFHQEAGFPSQRAISQLAPYKIPVAGMRGNADHAFVKVGQGDFECPPGESQNALAVAFCHKQSRLFADFFQNFPDSGIKVMYQFLIVGFDQFGGVFPVGSVGTADIFILNVENAVD